MTACTLHSKVNQIFSTARQLRGVGFDIFEEWVGTLLLAGLPEEYNMHVQSEQVEEWSGLQCELQGIVQAKLRELFQRQAVSFRLPFPTQGWRTNEVLELVHMDVCGLIEKVSSGGSRDYVSCIYDKTRKVSIYFHGPKYETELLNTSTTENRHPG